MPRVPPPLDPPLLYAHFYNAKRENDENQGGCARALRAQTQLHPADVELT